MGFQKSISYKNPRHGAPGPIGTSKSKTLCSKFAVRHNTNRAGRPQNMACSVKYSNLILISHQTREIFDLAIGKSIIDYKSDYRNENTCKSLSLDIITAVNNGENS